MGRRQGSAPGTALRGGGPSPDGLCPVRLSAAAVPPRPGPAPLRHCCPAARAGGLTSSRSWPWSSPFFSRHVVQCRYLAAAGLPLPRPTSRCPCLPAAALPSHHSAPTTAAGAGHAGDAAAAQRAGPAGSGGAQMRRHGDGSRLALCCGAYAARSLKHMYSAKGDCISMMSGDHILIMKSQMLPDTCSQVKVAAPQAALQAAPQAALQTAAQAAAVAAALQATAAAACSAARGAPAPAGL